MLKNQATPPIFNNYGPEKCMSLSKTQIAIDTLIVNSAAPCPDNYKYISEIRFE